MVPKVILVYSVFLVLAQASPQFDFPSSSEEEVSDAFHQSLIRLLQNPHFCLIFFQEGIPPVQPCTEKSGTSFFCGEDSSRYPSDEVKVGL